MNEVDRMAIQFGDELRQRVEPAFRSAPVELPPPVLDDIPQGQARRAVLPGRADVVGPSRAIQATVEVRQVPFRDVDAKRGDLHFNLKLTICLTLMARPPTVEAVPAEPMMLTHHRSYLARSLKIRRPQLFLRT